MKVPECIVLTRRHEVWLTLVIFLVLGAIVGRWWVAGKLTDIAFNESDYEWAPK